MMTIIDDDDLLIWIIEHFNTENGVAALPSPYMWD